MSQSLIESVTRLPLVEFQPGQILIEQGMDSGSAYILKSGTVQIEKDGEVICTLGETGAVIGEVSVLLNHETTATVKALSPVSAFVLDNPLQFALDNPAAMYMLSVQLAQRLISLNNHFAQLKKDNKELYQKLCGVTLT